MFLRSHKGQQQPGKRDLSMLKDCKLDTDDTQSDDRIQGKESTMEKSKSRKTSMPEICLANNNEDKQDMFYVGEPPCSPLAKMHHLLPPEVGSSSEELSSPRSRTGSVSATTGDDTDCDGTEHQQIQRRRRSSTLDKCTKKRGSVKDRKKAEGDAVQDASATLHKSKSEANVGIFRRGVQKLKSFRGGRRSSTGTSLSSSSMEDTITESVDDYPRIFTGFFMLFVNFTGDLSGYNKDKEDLRTFFEIQHGYEFREYTNCTAQEMHDAIDQAKLDIQSMISQEHPHIQLIVSILSHGEVEGIHTCKDKAGYLKETTDDSEAYKVTSLEDLIAKFKHDDQFDALKGMPKMFFIQACHGEEIVKAAGSSHSNKLKATRSLDDDESLNYNPTVPVDADLLVLFAASKYNKAFVPSVSGSWLIQTMLDVFKNMGKDTDVEVMLKVVTRAVAHKRGCTYENDKPELAVQVPFRQSSLRGNCYLQSKRG